MLKRYINVESSNISKLAYDPYMQRLWIIFNNGKEYQYEGVENRVFCEFIVSDSIGKFFHNFINKKYECKLLENKTV